MGDDIFTVLKSAISDQREIKKKSNDLIIQEKSSGAECKKVKIKTSSKVFCIELDNENERITNIFNDGAEGINKINDACLFFKKENKLIALLIELKSGSGGNYLNQLKSGKNFIEYLISQLKLFKPEIFGTIEVDYRAIRFWLPKPRNIPDKQTTRKRTNIVFEDRNGLLCADLTCNEEYLLKLIKKAVSE